MDERGIWRITFLTAQHPRAGGKLCKKVAAAAINSKARKASQSKKLSVHPEKDFPRRERSDRGNLSFPSAFG